MDNKHNRFMCRRIEWADKPGFLDPFTVVQQCIPKMAGAVHTNIKFPKCDVEAAKAIPLEICGGIQIYFHEQIEMPDIDEAVDQYIGFPCKMLLKKHACNLERALYFLLAYLRKRGPFIQWNVSDNEASQTSFNTRRFVTNWSTNYLQALPELDFCAATMIGRYLNYLVTVGYAHNVHYLDEILGKLYGPLFIGIHVTGDVKNRFTDEMLVTLPTKLFTRMIEGIPWSVMVPFENMTMTLQPNSKIEMTKKNDELANYIVESRALPSHLNNNMGDLAMRKNMAEGPAKLLGQPPLTEQQQKDLTKNIFATDRGHLFQDKCSLDPAGKQNILFQY